MGTQVNRASESVLVCCTCPDGETKYDHLCACPAPIVSYASLSKTAEQIGWREFFTTTVTSELPTTIEYYKYARPISTSTVLYTKTLSDGTILTTQYDIDPATEFVVETASGRSSLSKDFPATKNCTQDDFSFSEAATISVIGSNTGRNLSSTVTRAPVGMCFASSTGWTPDQQDIENMPQFGLFEMDTEEQALARASEAAGTSPTSIWQIRTYVVILGGGRLYSFSFTYRTSAYTIKSSTVVAGIEYQGCARLQRRVAYNGVVPEGIDTDWEDVEPDIIEPFFAAPDAEGVTTIAEAIDLPFARGYEYRVGGVYLWPTYADCDCPSEFEEVA